MNHDFVLSLLVILLLLFGASGRDRAIPGDKYSGLAPTFNHTPCPFAKERAQVPLWQLAGIAITTSSSIRVKPLERGGMAAWMRCGYNHSRLLAVRSIIQSKSTLFGALRP